MSVQNTLTVHALDSGDAWVEQTVARIVGVLQQAISDNGRASLMLSGGSTPAPIYQALSRTDLDWSCVTIGLVDERWVPLDHAGSNEALLRKNMLINNAAAAIYAPIQQPGSSPFTPVWDEHFNAIAPFDVIVLGMGPDGHTASLFPHAAGLEHALTTSHWVAPIEAIQSAVTGDLTMRITLTKYALSQSSLNIMLLKGDDKKAVFDQCQVDDVVADKPVRCLWQANMPPLELYLLTDKGLS